MWTYEETAKTSATPERVWELWSDVANWPDWNHGIEEIQADGPFAVGTRIRFTPPGEDEVTVTLTGITPGAEFIDEAVFGETVIRTIHRAQRSGDTTILTYRTEITGPGGEEIGPGITADFADVLATLIEQAEEEC
jgi:uncharacterized protein YndB with AHSA1/START domain